LLLSSFFIALIFLNNSSSFIQSWPKICWNNRISKEKGKDNIESKNKSRSFLTTNYSSSFSMILLILLKKKERKKERKKAHEKGDYLRIEVIFCLGVSTEPLLYFNKLFFYFKKKKKK